MIKLIMNKKIIIAGVSLLLLLLTNVMPSSAQKAEKKPLDVNACMLWKRVDNPDISQSGRWITYRISQMEPGDGPYESKTLHLYDTRTRRERLLKDVETLVFFDNDHGASYQKTDSAGTTKTILMNLDNGSEREWGHKEEFNPLEGTPFSASVTNVPADSADGKKAFTRLVIRNWRDGKAFMIDNIGYYTFYNRNRSIMFIKKQDDGNLLCYGQIGGPYQTLFRSTVHKEPASFNLDEKKLSGTFCISDSLWYGFTLAKNKCNLLFDRKSITVPQGMKIANIDLSSSRKYLTLELRPESELKKTESTPQAKEADKSFELELWTWNEAEVPTLQHRGRAPRASFPKYVYDITSGKLTLVAPSGTELLDPADAGRPLYTLCLDETPYKPQREWLDMVPFDIYSVNLLTGERSLVKKALRTRPRWAPGGKWAVMYDPQARAWFKFDAATGQLTDISTAIGHPVYDEEYDKPAPAPPYGLAGWTADGNNVIIYDAYDWWKIDLKDAATRPVCLTNGYGRRNRTVIRKLVSNIDRDVFAPSYRVPVSMVNTATMNEAIGYIGMNGSLKVQMQGPYSYNVHRFSGNGKYCIWSRQNFSTFRDLWWSRADYSGAVRITDANPQQKDYAWGTVKIVEWQNYENKTNRGLLYLPEDYDPKREYPVLVQFYETATGEKNVYRAPVLSSAMGEITYYVSNGYIVFDPDVHFTVGHPGQSCYDAVVSGVNYLIKEGMAHKGRIGLQGHSWSGFQTSWLVTKTNMFACANICAPITDMVTGYLGIRNGSGLPRYFMYEETQSRIGKTLWDGKELYRENSMIINADKIHTPLLIWHNDNDEAVAYEQGRALYLAMRRLHRPAWLLNYKGSGHFLSNTAARRDWTIRMKEFFDYYLKNTSEPRWMKEGIHLRERGLDQKYDLVGGSKTENTKP